MLEYTIHPMKYTIGFCFVWLDFIIHGRFMWFHYNDVIMSAMASQITSFTIVYSTVYSGADQRKHQSSASLAFVRGIHWSPVNSPHIWPVTQKMFPFDGVIMRSASFVKVTSLALVLLPQCQRINPERYGLKEPYEIGNKASETNSVQNSWDVT